MEMRIIETVSSTSADTMRVSFSTPSSFIHSYWSDRYCLISAMICLSDGVVLVFISRICSRNYIKIFPTINMILPGKSFRTLKNQSSLSTALSEFQLGCLILLTRFSISSRLNLMPFSRRTSLILLRVSSPFSGAKSIPKAGTDGCAGEESC